MKTNQLTRGKDRRLMYLENKDGLIDGFPARIGWVSFSKSGKSVYYRGRELARLSGGGVQGNFYDVETQEEYWISGVKKSGSNTHPTAPTNVEVDEDARDEFDAQRFNKS